MRRNIYPMTDKITWTASTADAVNLPDSGYITHIDCMFKYNVTVNSTPSLYEDAWARAFASARIKAAGAKTYFDITDGRQWKYWSWFKYKGKIGEDAYPTTATGAADYYAVYPIHWGLNPYDKFDRTVVIPARELTNLVKEITFGAAEAQGSDYIINSGEVTFMVYELVPEPGELKEDIWPRGLISPRMEPRKTSISTTYASLGLEDEVPVGDTLHETLIMHLDSSGDRSTTYCSEYGIKFPKRRETPIEFDWRPAEYIAYRDFDLGGKEQLAAAAATQATKITGVVLWPWSELTGDVAGLDLAAAVKGDCKLCFTIATASGTLHLLHYAIG